MLRIGTMLVALWLVAHPALGQTTKRESLASGGSQALGNSSAVSISADARYVAFASDAPDLVAGDTNGLVDVFVRDRVTGITTRISVDSTGAEANGASDRPAISADGRFVAFRSDASNLVTGDTNGVFDVFVHDRSTGQTTRASVDSTAAEANGASDFPSLSADGRYVAFESSASNLVSGDSNGVGDVFVRDRLAGQTSRVSVDSSGAQGNGASNSSPSSISADGRYVVFDSVATNLVAGDTNGKSDVFVHDRSTGQTTRASVDSGGAQANGASLAPAISADGEFVAFESLASNLVPGDANGAFDVFVRDLQAGVTSRASVDSAGVEGDLDSGSPSSVAISGDGRFVAFASAADNLVAGDTNTLFDVFLRDRTAATTVRASTLPAAESDGDSFSPALSADGRFVGYESFATNLVPEDTNGTDDVFVWDGQSAPVVALCFGDGLDPAIAAFCPCFNFGAPLRGCANSQSANGTHLDASGASNPDAVVLVAAGELATSLSIFAQSATTKSAGAVFGDGVFCLPSTALHLYTKNAVLGVATAPTGNDPSISARSAALGDPIAPGSVRYYQTYYRDRILSFCSGSGFNVTNAIGIYW